VRNSALSRFSCIIVRRQMLEDRSQKTELERKLIGKWSVVFVRSFIGGQCPPYEARNDPGARGPSPSFA